MKSIKYFLGIAILNMYYLAAWIFVFNSNDTVAARQADFLHFFPFFNNIAALTFSILVINAISISTLIFNYQNFKKPLASTLLIIQLSFVLINIWQLL